MAADALIDRRAFLATTGAAALVGCTSRHATTVRLINGNGAGTATIGILHLFARALNKLGITTTVEAVPRGGGVLAAQMLASAPRDGTSIAQLPSSLIYAQVLRQEGLPNDLASFEWIGSMPVERRVLVVSGHSGVSRFDQLLTRAKPLILATGSLQGSNAYEAAIIQHLTGARLKAVPGFVGGARQLAMISGEVDGLITSLDSVSTLLDLPSTRILLRINDAPLPAGLAGAAPGGVPWLGDVARGPDAPLLMMLVRSYTELGRGMALPPGTPAEIVALWRKRFQQIVTDPDFMRDAAALKIDAAYDSGPAVEAIHRRLSQLRPHIEPALRRALATADAAVDRG